MVKKKSPTAAEKKAATKTENKPAVSLEPEVKSSRYYEARGARKTSVARVRIFTKDTGIQVNGKDYKSYFVQEKLQKIVAQPFETMNVAERVSATVKVNGGGINGQAEAIRNGLSRALVLFNADFRKRLRRHGFLTRDSRMVERKKYGLKKARRAPQWAKR